ncbi:MAG: ABC transporter permease, partial [Bacteroidota bacterium]
MIRKLLTVAFRNLKKSTLFSFINILGLAIGLAASIIIYLWVYDELSSDRFHENAQRIYRVEREFTMEEEKMLVPITSPPTAPQMESDFPSVVSFTRLAYDDAFIEDESKNQFKERIFYADSSFFKIFSFPVVKGNPETCLTEPFTITMSESAASKYLGPEPELGRVINVNYGGEMRPYTLTAIFEDFPHNSHIKADIIGSFGSLKSLKHEMMMTSWMASFHYSYILIDENTDPEDLEENLQKMVDLYFGPEMRNMMKIQEPTDVMKLRLKPITDIHLDSNRTWELESPGSKNSVAIFSLVALLLLVIAGVNFMNLSTARASRRALEVGIRKISGASKPMLIRQFLGESLFYSLFSLIIAFLLIELSLPAFSEFTGKEMTSSLLLKGWNLPFIILVWIITAVISGIYPAFVLSSYKPIKVLKGKTGPGGGETFRRILVIGQFVISVGLIICSVTAFRHLQYISNKDLGYNRYGLLDISIEDRSVYSSWDALSNDIKALPEVEGITRSSIVPTDRNYTDNPYLVRGNSTPFFPVVNSFDENYLPVLEIPLLAGENFRSGMINDSSVYYLINDAARKMFGFKDPHDALGKEIGVLSGPDNQSRNWGQIVGVTEDFHFQALTEEIRPMVMSSSLSSLNHITIRVDENAKEEAYQNISEIWQKYNPDKIFSGVYISQKFDHQHLTEKRLQVILLIFTVLSIFVACLGLFGLSVFSVEQRTKEIGIRKSMGAGINQIIGLISWDYLRLVLIAILISVPISFFIMKDWLNNFPYRRGLEIWVFIAAAAIAVIAAFLTVFIQT